MDLKEHGRSLNGEKYHCLSSMTLLAVSYLILRMGMYGMGLVFLHHVIPIDAAIRYKAYCDRRGIGGYLI